MHESPSLISLRRVLGKLVVAVQLLLFLVSAPVFASALIPQVNWTLKSVDSGETRGEDGAAKNAFDGDVSTFWHTQWQGSSPRHPHKIDIDLGAVHDLDGFRYLSRQVGGVNGRVARYAFYVSLDGVTWGSAVATGTFRNTAQEQEVSFALTQGRYVRFEALSEVNGRPWTSVAELNLLGTVSSGANVEPNGVINTPGDGATVAAGGTLNFTGSGSDPDSNALLSYRWTFGDPTVADLTVKDPRNVMFHTPGTHTVTLTAVDHLGLADSTPATIRVTVNSLSTASVPPQTGVIPQTDGSLFPGTEPVSTSGTDNRVDAQPEAKSLYGSSQPDDAVDWAKAHENAANIRSANSCSQLQTELDQANPGDMILVETGEYEACSIKITRSGTQDRPIIVTSRAHLYHKLATPLTE